MVEELRSDLDAARCELEPSTSGQNRTTFGHDRFTSSQDLSRSDEVGHRNVDFVDDSAARPMVQTLVDSDVEAVHEESDGLNGRKDEVVVGDGDGAVGPCHAGNDNADELISDDDLDSTIFCLTGKKN